MEIEIDGNIYPVQIEHKRIRNMYLRIGEDGSLRVSCPVRVTDSEVRRFVLGKTNWILKTAVRQSRKRKINETGVTGPIIYWLGEKKYVRYEHGRKDSMRSEGDILTFVLREADEEHIEKAFEAAARKQISALCAQYRAQWDELICRDNRISIPDIKVRHMTSRWGVCYPSRGIITMSSRLVHYPPCSTAYVLLHEYVHFLVPNHSKKFYRIIEEYMPDYKEFDSFLK